MFVDAANPADVADHRSVGFAEKALGRILTRAAFLYDWSGLAKEGTGLFPKPLVPF